MPPPPIVKKRAKPAPKAKKAVAEKKAPAEKKGKGKVTERSRSTSVMPVEKEVEDEKDVHEEDEKVEDDRLYCLCRAKYNHDDTMVGCDRCDEWYHPACVDMADTPLDLVDQFICPPCVMKHPDLNLKTTYKMRCLNGLEDPDRETACPRPARGAVSKYCSQECGVKNMRRRIEAYTAKGGKKADLWEKVKDAERREGLVVRLGNGHIGKSRTKREREVEKLQTQLDAVSMQRETVKRSMDVAVWRERLLELAVGRAEAKQDECGWDQRLCFGEEEWEEFGEGALENYGSSDEEWWCPGPADCDRHVGWQAVRHDDIAHEKEKQEEALMKLTTREREIRKTHRGPQRGPCSAED
ncbi:hypothetical protein BDZ89DRAFT_942869 [Hymenopellis radicata]|nr:hypothetical protein BDZ89DRAFT_942869 [Hymenopellis radicata]